MVDSSWTVTVGGMTFLVHDNHFGLSAEPLVTAGPAFALARAGAAGQGYGPAQPSGFTGTNPDLRRH
jgi:hypothetical protein